MKTAYLKYLAAMLLFGSNGIVAAHITLESHAIVLLRTLIGSLFLLGVFALSRPAEAGRASPRAWASLVLSGVAMGASWILLFAAYDLVGVSVATLAYYCGPVMVMALAPLLFGEAMSGARVLGLCSVLAGMLLVNRQALAQGGLGRGLAYGILSAVMYAAMIIFNKKATGIRGLKNALAQLAVSFVTVGLFTLARQGAAIALAPADIPPILLLGVVNTGLGCYLYFSSIPRLPVQTVAICGYLDPASALLFSAVFLRERLSPLQWVGTLLILGGAALGELRGRRIPPGAGAGAPPGPGGEGG